MCLIGNLPQGVQQRPQKYAHQKVTVGYTNVPKILKLGFECLQNVWLKWPWRWSKKIHWCFYRKCKVLPSLHLCQATFLFYLFQCPRDFKRTSVERHFREKGFAVDWCAFRLLNVDDNDVISEVTALPPVEQESVSHFLNGPIPASFFFFRLFNS